MLSKYSCALFLLVVFLREYHANRAGCIFMSGDGVGSTWTKVGMQTGMACVDACLGKRRSNKDINGATVLTNGKGGCWCYMKMVGRRANSHYKTCFIAETNLAGDNRCTYLVGHGIGGSQVKAGNQKGSQCVDACLMKKRKDPKINGVTVLSNNQAGCWCERMMKGRDDNAYYKSCFIGETGLFGDYRCKFAPGDGKGGSDFKVGNQKGSQCVDACLIKKRTDPTINGVTVYGANYAGCWCEKKMTYRNSNAKWKSCYILRKGRNDYV